MTPQQLTNWGNDLYEDLYNRWNKWSESCPHIKEKGYALFYSEIKMNPDLMIIGYNPGWNKDFKPETAARKIPDAGYHDYYKYDYTMAKKMRSIFSGELDTILRNSVKLNLLFFNSQNITEWYREVEKELRLTIENYCLETTYNIIDTLQPKRILTEGFGTFNRLVFNQENKRITTTDHYLNSKCILYESKVSDIPVMGIKHPTGTRGMTNEIWDAIREMLKDTIPRSV